MDDVIEEWKIKVNEEKRNYTDLFSEHEQLKQDFKAKDDEAKYFKNEFAKYKE
jgi:predicted nuclease with TOPRIM domain